MAETSKIVGARLSVAIAHGLAIVRQFVIWAFADVPETVEVRRPVEPRRLSLADQWSRLSDIVIGAAQQAETATGCHVSATQQIDLAQYALSSLIDELSSVMDMGDRVRRRATVHVLGVAPMPALRPIGGAIAA
ncbi:hypothetical protein [Hyphomicrobium sp. DY-1]|uniref:hypothetical protein n=1 Tax=Hyphomicrobium sp. DY-1 TaxID=3075650 RepID=UPI0039C2BEB6